MGAMKKAALAGVMWIAAWLTAWSVTPVGVYSRVGMLTSQEVRTIGADEPLKASAVKAMIGGGRFVTSATWSPAGWTIVTSKVSQGWTAQEVTVADEWPDEWYREKTDKGMIVTTIAASENQMLLVATAGGQGREQQVMSLPREMLIENIVRCYNRDLWIETATYFKGLWLVVMNGNSYYDFQSSFVASSLDEVRSEVEERRRDDRTLFVTSLTYNGHGHYLVVLSAVTSGRAVDQKIVSGRVTATGGGEGYVLTALSYTNP